VLENPGETVTQPGRYNRNSLKMTGKRVSYTLDSTLESVNTIEQIADKFAMDAGFDEENRHKIAMAVREASVNAVLHGNAYDPAKKVTVGFDTTGDGLAISIADQGRGLDPATVPDPLAPENLLKQSGRGIFLIRTFMDEVRFRVLEPGTEITLIKRRGDAAESKEGSQ
jgi:serine/threonine-protein kinase RsbW